MVVNTLEIKTERYTKQIKTLRQLIILYPKIKVDYSIQRPFRWSENRFREYFNAALNGLGNKRILLADTSECLNYSADQKAWDSYLYYENLLKNDFEKVSIDGNGRTTGLVKNVTEGWAPQVWDNYVIRDKMGSIHPFNFDIYRKFKGGNQEGKLTFSLYNISSEEQILESKIRKYTLNNGKNKTYELEVEDTEFLLKFYDFILDNMMYEIYNYDSLLKPDLGILFVNENLNERIYQQDIRNALPKPLSEIVRNMCDENTTLGKMWIDTITDTDYIKRIHQEITAFCVMFLRNKSSFINGGTKKLTQTELTNFYKNSSDNFKLTDNEKKIINLIPSCVMCDGEYQANVFKEKTKVFDYLAICEGIVEENCSITTIDWEKIREVRSNWFIEKNKRDDYELTAGVDGKRGNFTSYRGNINRFTTDDWYDDIRNNLIPTMINDGILIKRKERITVWPSWVKELLWHEQNKKCPLTNKPIPESEIFDGKKWEVEHDLALENGGTNDLDNLQLACPTENKKKGSKKNYKPLTTYA